MNRKNINIGKDYWIIWVDPDLSSVHDIDELLDPIWIFWQKLETQCLTECCSIYAFSFWSEDIQKAIEGLDKKKLLLDIENLKKQIENSEFQSFSSKKLNDTLEKSVLKRLLIHFEQSIKGLNL